MRLEGLVLAGGADALLADLACCEMLEELAIEQVVRASSQGGVLGAVQWLLGTASSSRFSMAGLMALANGACSSSLETLRIDTGGAYHFSSEDLAVLLGSSWFTGLTGVPIWYRL